MTKKVRNNKNFTRSELRQDIVSGEWVLVAPDRFHLGKFYKKIKKHKRIIPPKSKDIFKNPLKSVDEHIIWGYSKDKNPEEIISKSFKRQCEILVLENKYPAVGPNAVPITKKKCIFPIVPGLGHHDLLITKGYTENFPKLSKENAFRVFQAFRDRYLMFFGDPYIRYVSIFHNWGSMAGASVFHPHYQIIGIPVIPPDVVSSLNGSKKYFREHKKCVHCAIINWEKKQKKRIIFESKYAIAIAPFVSKSGFQVKILPKRHRSFFENTYDYELADISDVLQKVLRKVEKNLGDPDYNFYIHTPPAENKNKYKFYHWHIEVVPRLNIQAGFEYGTGMVVNVVDPDLAASILRK